MRAHLGIRGALGIGILLLCASRMGRAGAQEWSHPQALWQRVGVSAIEICEGRAGQLHVVWREVARPPIFGSRLCYSCRSEGRWSPPLILRELPHGQIALLRVVVNEEGNAVVLWSEATGFYVTSKNGWRGWPLLGAWLNDSGLVRIEMLMKDGFYDVGGFDVVAAPGQTLYACWEDLPLATWRLLMVDRLGQSQSTVPLPRFALLKPNLGIARRPDLWVGEKGRLHASFVGATREEGGLLKPRNLLRYTERDPDTGRWSEPVLVWSDSSTSASPSQVVVGADGLRHLVWFRASEDSWRGTLLHSLSSDGLEWTTAAEVAPGPEWLCDSHFSVVPDYAGRLHAVWAGLKDGGTTYSYAWWQDGAWQPPVCLLSGDSTRGPGVFGLCTGPDSSLHLIWMDVTRPRDLWEPLPSTMLHSVFDLRRLTSKVEVPLSAGASRKLVVAAYPNPFNESVVFKVNGGVSEPLILVVFDLEGRLVRALDMGIPSSFETAFRWDGKDQRGEPLPSGVYYYQVSGSHGAQKRMAQARGKVLLLR